MSVSQKLHTVAALACFIYCLLQGPFAFCMTLTSDAFVNDSVYPTVFSCDGRNVNPPLTIDNIPVQTVSLALTVVDCDAPIGTFVHWIVFDIPVVKSIKENSIPGTQGINDSGGINWVSPCPPSGIHRYIFTVYALDSRLGFSEGISIRDFDRALKGHIIAQARLTGLYKR